MLKINPEKDIKELEKFGFKKEIKKEKIHKYECEHGKEEYYIETLWKYDDGINAFFKEVKRKNYIYADYVGEEIN